MKVSWSRRLVLLQSVVHFQDIGCPSVGTETRTGYNIQGAVWCKSCISGERLRQSNLLKCLLTIPRTERALAAALIHWVEGLRLRLSVMCTSKSFSILVLAISVVPCAPVIVYLYWREWPKLVTLPHNIWDHLFLDFFSMVGWIEKFCSFPALYKSDVCSI